MTGAAQRAAGFQRAAARRRYGVLLASVIGMLMASALMSTALAAAPNSLGLSIEVGKPGAVPVADALKIILMLTALALAPGILIAMTSFTRTIIVLSMIRHGFGMQDTPPNLVLLS
ncbi:MAG TPA: hypothetical protein VNZ06_09695, partial [Steroidobacteraceae bacterium]|nr:hypothetical protein [Steroidobacteraceae bacterium]